MAELKPGWRRVKFGEMVRQVKDKVDPEESGLTRFVAGEHMDTDDLRIRRWGEIGDGYLGPAFHMRFKPGQVLYGSRRTYLRKVAVPDFEGICANTTFVLESSKPEVLLPELLPFVMTAEAFHEHSRRESKGSVNPYVNYSDLAWYEFELPPLEEQLRIKRLLSSAHNAVDCAREAATAAKIALQATLLESIETRGRDWRSATLETLISNFIDYRGKTPQKTESGVPLITAKNVRDGFLDFSDPEWIAFENYERWMTRGIPNEGDILLTTEAPLGLVAKAPQGKFALAQRIICLQPSSDVDPRFLFWTLRSCGFQREIRKRSTGTTVNGIKQSVLRKITVRVPPLDRQAEAAMTIEKAAEGVRLAEEDLSAKVRLMKSIRRFVY
jgi:type I restriction enzyme S subunit